MAGGGRQKPRYSQSKTSERQVRAAHRRQKKHAKRAQVSGEDDGDFVSLRTQLEVIGLTLKEVPGDGNCLFRAMSDQLHGDDHQHGNYRQDVVNYMRQHRDDFEPFLVDETSYDRHLELLGQDGTFGGNDSIVAFARLHNLTIVIHQLNEPLWQVHGTPDGSACERELHISYHNGDHYNSVRRLGDLQTRRPANVKISVLENQIRPDSHSNSTASNDVTTDDNSYRRDLSPDEDDGELSDYDNYTKDEREMVRKVMKMSGVLDQGRVLEALESNANIVESAVDYLLQEQAMLAARQATSGGIWDSGGTGNRIFGDAVSGQALGHGVSGSGFGSGPRTNVEKLENIQKKLQTGQLTNKRRKELKKAERKLANGERKKNGQNGRSDQNGAESSEPIAASLQALSI